MATVKNTEQVGVGTYSLIDALTSLVPACTKVSFSIEGREVECDGHEWNEIMRLARLRFLDEQVGV
jgi:hypothetical protein